MAVTIDVAVEGDIDEAVVRRLIALAGGDVSRVYIGPGKPAVVRNLSGYNNAARYSPWAVLVDLDSDCDCAPPCRDRWLPYPAPLMSFRIAVRAVEAWLLADRERIAHFLRVRPARVPGDPERLDDPKSEVVAVARHSTSRRIREDLVPRPESGRRVGPLYASSIIRFVQDVESGWRPDVACRLSDSLARCMRGFATLIGRTS
jgi:hypothetical protein